MGAYAAPPAPESRPHMPAASQRRLATTVRVLRTLARRTSFVESEVALLDGLVPPGGVALDVGAEYGLYTLACADRVGRSGRVIAFEPLPGPNRFVRRAVRWLGARQVQVRRHALGDRARAGTLSLPRRRGLPVHGRAFLADDADGPGPNAEFAGEQRVPVEVRTLDDVVEAERLERVDFVKLDVEGFEPAVLRGAEHTIARFRPRLLIEIEDRHLAKFGVDSRAVVDLLREQGYTATTWWQGRWEPVDTVTERTRNYLFTPA